MQRYRSAQTINLKTDRGHVRKKYIVQKTPTHSHPAPPPPHCSLLHVHAIDITTFFHSAMVTRWEFEWRHAAEDCRNCWSHLINNRRLELLTRLTRKYTVCGHDVNTVRTTAMQNIGQANEWVNLINGVILWLNQDTHMHTRTRAHTHTHARNQRWGAQYYLTELAWGHLRTEKRTVYYHFQLVWANLQPTTASAATDLQHWPQCHDFTCPSLGCMLTQANWGWDKKYRTCRWPCQYANPVLCLIKTALKRFPLPLRCSLPQGRSSAV